MPLNFAVPQRQTTRQAPLRIGIFGGTFNPVHQAHVALATTALEQLQLDELLWVPVGDAWQKKADSLASASERALMVSLAIEHEPRFTLDWIELQRSGPSYTIDTVKEIQQRYPGATVFLIIGQDQYVNLHTWHQWRDLLPRVTLAVAARDGETPSAKGEIAHVWHRFKLLQMPRMNVSSTQIRHHLEIGRSAVELAPEVLPTSVAQFIQEQSLYRL